MDRRRPLSPVYTRQWSTASSNDSPTASPAHPHSRNSSLGGAGAFSTVKRTQNVAAKAAARRLAQVMATQTAAAGDDDDDDDDADDLFGPPPSLVPPAIKRRNVTAVASVNGVGGAGSSSNGFNGGFPARSTNRAPSPAIGRTFVEPVPSVRSSSTGRPTTVRTTAGAPPVMKTPVVIPPVELPTPKTRVPGRFPDFGSFDSKVSANEPEQADLLDKLDLLQQENENVLEQLREAERRREESEARAKQLELQVASMGEGLSLEAKLMRRKEAALRQREAALAAAKRRSEGKEEIATLQSEMENIRAEAATIMDKLEDAETEAKSLRIMTQRMILTHEEKEEVMLKRCWLARYWGLAVQYGICADIAGSKYEHWSRYAPLPFEVVTSAGQKAKQDLERAENNSDRRSKSSPVQGDLTGEGNIETMLSVEMGLREMASLKIEDAIALSMGQRRRPNLIRDQKLVADPKFMESFELSQEESDDVLFKEAWLAYFWKRAKDHQVEEGISEDRLKQWSNRTGQSPTLQDAVDVDRGLIELRKLGIEQQLWEASRKEIEHDPSMVERSDHKHDAESENSNSS